MNEKKAIPLRGQLRQKETSLRDNVLLVSGTRRKKTNSLLYLWLGQNKTESSGENLFFVRVKSWPGHDVKRKIGREHHVIFCPSIPISFNYFLWTKKCLLMIGNTFISEN